MIFSINEILDIIIMTLALGFIFKDSFVSPRSKINPDNYDPVAHYRNIGKRYDINGFKTAIIIVAPAILLHELGHKLVALSFGMTAEFHAAYWWLALGILMKLVNFGFIFFVPAYVSIGGSGLMPWQSSAIAFAGPGINLILFLVPFLLMRNKAFVNKYRKYVPMLFITSRINVFLFIFNMLPIPMFDGWTVYSGLIHTFF